jgi:site-specific recombinase XerD
MIMLETHLHSPVTRRRLRKGLAADHIDAFADWLNLSGYKPISIRTLLTGLAGWTDWMCAAGFTVQELIQGFEACRSAVRKKHRVHYRGGPNRKSLTAASIFIRFLQDQGKLSRSTAPGASDVWPILAAFRSWMSTHRGLTDTTLDLYEGIVAGLLDALGDDARNYSAETLRNFVAARARPHGISRANSIVVAVRSFVRYLGVTGQCSPGMEHAIPAFASWQLSSVPRFLSGDEVDQVIGSCNGYVFELRDRAVILLLARLGLRASEVAHLRFTDIDWRNGTITFGGKGRRQESLPLPQEVGNAIMLYVKQARPLLKVPEVFTTVLAPFHAVTRAVVTHIVRGALRRAGIKAPINGAHVLRHSAATSMLRQGASLAGVGAVLRHRSPETTAHYAKVDFVLLAEIAQPWPEVSSC